MLRACNLATNCLVQKKRGAVGVIAAQSIGEPVACSSHCVHSMWVVLLPISQLYRMLLHVMTVFLIDELRTVDSIDETGKKVMIVSVVWSKCVLSIQI